MVSPKEHRVAQSLELRIGLLITEEGVRGGTLGVHALLLGAHAGRHFCLSLG